MNNKVILTAAITGTAIYKDVAPTVPEQPEEIAEQVVQVAKAGAAIAHLHIRDEKGLPTMRIDRYEQVFRAVKAATEKAGVDIIINLTTSGSQAIETSETRTEPLRRLHPEMCSFDAGTFNWHYGSVFVNAPDFLDYLSKSAIACDVKPEFEIFDCGMIGNSIHCIETFGIPKPCHFQLVLGVGGGMDATTKNLEFLVSQLPEGSTWSVTGIGKGHMPMMLAGLALGCTGLRAGLEDNLYFSRGVKATNVQLVERAAQLSILAGRQPATADEAREMLGITRHSLAEYQF